MTALTTDPYPTRLDAPAPPAARREPIIHHAPDPAAAAVLSDEQLSRYQANGFLSFDRFFPDEVVAACQQELHRLRETGRGSGRVDIITEPGTDEVRSVFDVHRQSAIFSALCRDPGLLAIVRRLLGSDVYIHQSRINYKPGFDGKEFYWHSDFETWHAEDGMPAMRAVSCSISLTASNEWNGPLMLIPGSHQLFVPCMGETPADHYKQSLKRQRFGVPGREDLTRLVDKAGIVAPKGPPGSMTVFECNVMHGSNGNISPYPRSNVFFVFNSVENVVGTPFCGRPPRPEHIRSTDFTPLRALDEPFAAHLGTRPSERS